MHIDFEGIAFDLDGTLYPNYRLHYKLLPFLFKEFRLLTAFGKARTIIRREQEDPSYPKDDFYRRQAEIVAKIIKLPPKETEEKIDRLIYRGWESLFLNIKLFKGAAQTIASLRKASYKLGVLSDFPPEKKLEYLKISGIWDAVLCSESFGAIKPHPLSFTELAKKMGLPPERILYVGNSHPYDVIGAHRAGMKTALIKSPLSIGSRKKPIADFIFNDYRQLYDFMIN